MKFLLIVTFALLAFVAADDDWDVSQVSGQNTYRIHDECVEESKMTEEQQEKMRGKDRGFPDEKEIRDYVLCSTKKFGVFTEDKGFNNERLMKVFLAMKLDEEKTRAIVTDCMDSNEQKSAPVEWASRGFGCLMDKGIDKLFKEAMEKMEKNKKNEE